MVNHKTCHHFKWHFSWKEAVIMICLTAQLCISVTSDQPLTTMLYFQPFPRVSQLFGPWKLIGVNNTFTCRSNSVNSTVQLASCLVFYSSNFVPTPFIHRSGMAGCLLLTSSLTFCCNLFSFLCLFYVTNFL